MTSIETRIQKWLEGPYDEATKEEIRHLMQTDPQALFDAFFKDLSFGTGGMRGVMGVGTNRINIYTIRKATQGLADYIRKNPGPHSVFIGYDTRINSRKFAMETASVLAGNGIAVLLSQDICPTPLVSFACRYFQCSAAVMITASHNPPQYNGYKVYWKGGAQVVAPHDSGILEEVNKNSPVKSKPTFQEVGSELDALYLNELKKWQIHPGDPTLKIIYSNLHGTGIRLVPDALKSWGYTNVSLVEKQKTPDGHFPFAPSPNPEEEKALHLGTDQLIEEKGDLFIATDPDADRIGAVVLDQGNPIRLTGNQIACLCVEHLCRTRKLPPNGAFIKTIVTTELFKSIVEKHKALCFDVLTGFKYIAEKIGKWEEKGDPQFIFGGEESYGFLVGTFVRDKDAISTACLLAEMASFAKKENSNLNQRLELLYQEYGIHREALVNIAFPNSQEGMQKMEMLMQRLRENPPNQIGGQNIQKTEDYLPGYNNLPPSDVLRFWLSDGSKLVIRPSGTEPKIKVYIEVVQRDKTETIASCDARLQALVQSWEKEVF